MKGDFSWFNHQPHDNFTGVLEQQGRVRLDRDGLATEEINRSLRTLMGRDTFGPGRVAVPTEASQSFRVTSATTDGQSISISYAPGHAWIDGIPLLSETTITTDATYLTAPLQAGTSPDSIEFGVRDAVILEVWEDSISAFQDTRLLEPALGGVDTTARVKVCHRIRLRRLAADEDCRTLDLRDDVSALGRLTVTPEPAIAVTGDCPVEAGGGYSGDGHRLMCIEVASPRGTGPRFAWSRFGGGLVGRGRFDAVENTIAVTHNHAMIDAASVSGMIIQALAPDGTTGCWSVVFEATVSMVDGVLAVANAQGTWPAPAGEHAFFRLWDGISEIADFNTATALADGIKLQFDAPDGQNYRVGDRWFFEARTAGTDFDPSNWPQSAPPQSIRYHRAPLGILNWNGAAPSSLTIDDIDDCRDSFPPLTDPCPCCTIVVGDGDRTHGDENSIEAAIARLPSAGGVICLLPGQHQCSAVIRERANITITGCSKNTRVVPRSGQREAPIFHIVDSECIALLDMEMISLGGVCVLAESSNDESLRQVLIHGNHILACVRAIQVEGGSEIVIAKNRVRMLDKSGAGVAIYLTAEDSRIEDNDIGVVPARMTPRPPEDPDDEEPPQDPNDPCADEEKIYANAGFFIGFVSYVFGFTLTSIVPPPYRALGGIQIGGGAERIGVIDNRILGGAGNGITLGGSHLSPVPQPTNGPLTQNLTLGRSVVGLSGIVNDPNGSPAAGVTLRVRSPDAAQRTFTTNADGEFEINSTGVAGVHIVEPVNTGIGIEQVAVLQTVNLAAGSLMILRIDLNLQGNTVNPRTGFIYSLRIEDNEITAMGLNGIGIPPALSVLDIEEDSTEPATPPIIEISGERVTKAGVASARETRFTRERAAAVSPVFERIGNPVIDLTVTNNRIYSNLATPFSAAMRDFASISGFGGISLGLCETVTISNNRIERNGRRHVDPICGIFVLFGEQVEINGNLIRDNGPFNRSDADIVAGQRGGISGFFTTFGVDRFVDDDRSALPAKPALRIHDNVVQQPMGRALTLLTAGPVSIVDNHLSAERSGTDRKDRLAGSMLMMNLSGVAGLASGGCLVATNQVSLGQQSEAFTAITLAAADDIGFDANQVTTHHLGTLSGNLATSLNTLIFAKTLRATGNRFKEPITNPESAFQLSLLSMSTGMNTTTSNQGDHCIFAFDQGTPQHLIDEGNLEFNNDNCAKLRSAAAGASRNPMLGAAGLTSFDFIGSIKQPSDDSLIYGSTLDNNLIALNGYYVDRIDDAAEHKALTSALLSNEISRLEARTSVRADILHANRLRLAAVNREVDSIRAARDIVATKPEPIDKADSVVLQGRVIDSNGKGIRFAEIKLATTRGRAIAEIDGVQSDVTGGFVLRISNEVFEMLSKVLQGKATIVATTPGDDQQSVVSKVFPFDSESVLVPDITINVKRNVQPIKKVPFVNHTVTNAVRPILSSSLRPSATSGRIAPLLRASRATEADR